MKKRKYITIHRERIELMERMLDKNEKTDLLVTLMEYFFEGIEPNNLNEKQQTIFDFCKKWGL